MTYRGGCAAIAWPYQPGRCCGALCFLYAGLDHSQSRFDLGVTIFRDEPRPGVAEMSDILYLSLGLGTFVVLALYARNLGRI